MRFVLATIIVLHAAIHLFGFFKAFGIANFEAIRNDISNPMGLLWLLAFALFITSLVLWFSSSQYWMIVGMIAAIISQGLILYYWSDAKYGTIINLIFLVTILLSYANYSFKQTIERETTRMFIGHPLPRQPIIKRESINHLPDIVQSWLINSGTVGTEPINSVFLTQDIKMKLKPEQTTWTTAFAKQFFTTTTPAFNWSVNLKMNPLMPVVGRDKFEDGTGEMTIKVLSLIPMVSVKNNDKINQATLQRYLAEIVWFPSAALQPYITWEEIDAHTARATMTYQGTSGSGVFYFDENGRFEKFVALRYKDVDENAAPMPWTIIATKTEQRNGIRIPVEVKVSWTLEGNSWTWLELTIPNIRYN